jgi:hypothetical protein
VWFSFRADTFANGQQVRHAQARAMRATIAYRGHQARNNFFAAPGMRALRARRLPLALARAPPPYIARRVRRRWPARVRVRPAIFVRAVAQIVRLVMLAHFAWLARRSATKAVIAPLATTVHLHHQAPRSFPVPHAIFVAPALQLTSSTARARLATTAQRRQRHKSPVPRARTARPRASAHPAVCALWVPTAWQIRQRTAKAARVMQVSTVRLDRRVPPSLSALPVPIASRAPPNRPHV